MTENNNGYKRTVEHRLSVIETQLATILTNHLPHIEKELGGIRADMKDDMDTIRTRLWVFMGTAALAFLTAAINLGHRLLST